jgi:hypothetical protein
MHLTASQFRRVLVTVVGFVSLGTLASLPLLAQSTPNPNQAPAYKGGSNNPGTFENPDKQSNPTNPPGGSPSPATTRSPRKANTSPTGVSSPSQLDRQVASSLVQGWVLRLPRPHPEVLELTQVLQLLQSLEVQCELLTLVLPQEPQNLRLLAQDNELSKHI